MKEFRQLFPFILAGFAGGVLTLGGYFIVQQNTPPSDIKPAQFVNVAGSPNAATNEFVLAAAAAMPVVVHIKASESDQLARKRHQQDRARNPWGTFEDDFFFGFRGQGPYIQRKEGSGSGVIYSKDGYIVTNNHVIEFADQVEVTTYDNRKFTAQIIGTDPKTDMAVLKIDATGLPTLPLSDSDAARVGEWVLAVGNPFDLTSTVTAGIISAKGRNIDIIKTKDAIEAFIQTDAAVNPGNSGGALVDTEGRLLGINTAIATPTGFYSGYSFAIPINMVRRIVDDIIDHGYYQRGKMGLTVVELDGELAKELNLVITQGLVVDQLEEGGAAALAGLKSLDVIVEANGKPVRTFSDLQEQASQARSGDFIVLNVYRKGKYMRLNISLR
ncbi:MAG: trypsin-like peptidase domain-containing protein [Saprospiraceae bacterium]|nr:trypsin-like peptidase domain-containing protein [Saprospiraceae bacterium]